MCFMTWKRPTNPNFQLVRKKDGKIKIARIKTSRTAALRQNSRPVQDPEQPGHLPSNVEAPPPPPPPQPAVPGPEPPSNIQAQSPRPHVPCPQQCPNGQSQLQQQQQPCALAPHTSPSWTLDHETTLTELMREGLNIQDIADTLDRTVEDVAERWADVEGENRLVERRGRDRQRVRRRAANPPLTNQAPPPAAPGTAPVVALVAVPTVAPAVAPMVTPVPAPTVAPVPAPTAAPATAPTVAPVPTPRVTTSERPRSVRPISVNPDRNAIPIQTALQPVADLAAPVRARSARTISRRPADRNAVPIHTEPNPVAALLQPRRRRWVNANSANQETQDEMGDGRLQRARERLEKLRHPMVPVGTDQDPLAAPAARLPSQQRRGRSERSTSRKPAHHNTVAVHGAPEFAPAEVLQRRNHSSSASHRQRTDERGRFSTGSTSARTRPIHRHRSSTPQGRKNREQSAVKQSKKPAVAPASSHNSSGLPGTETVWTRGPHGWVSREIRIRPDR